MLTPAQLQDFSSDGSLTIRGLYNAGEMREITAWTDEVTAWPEVPGRHMMYFEESRLEAGRRILSRMEDFEPYHSGFSRLFNDRSMKRDRKSVV